MSVKPLAITQPHWESFIKTTEEGLGYSPTRGIDQKSIPIERPDAYLASLSLDNNPNIKKDGRFKHIFMSFIGIMSVKQTLALASLSISILSKETPKGEYLVIMSGDLAQWHDSVIIGLKDPVIQSIFEEIYSYFKRANLNVWDSLPSL